MRVRRYLCGPGRGSTLDEIATHCHGDHFGTGTDIVKLMAVTVMKRIVFCDDTGKISHKALLSGQINASRLFAYQYTTVAV